MTTGVYGEGMSYALYVESEPPPPCVVSNSVSSSKIRGSACLIERSVGSLDARLLRSSVSGANCGGTLHARGVEVALASPMMDSPKL